MESAFFLIVLLVIGYIAKNQSLMVAVAVLLVLKYSGLGDKIFPLVQKKGINWGVTVITIAVLIPIATGEIGIKQLGSSLKSSYAWIALLSGIAVALIAQKGVILLAEDPHITAALVFGTILAIALFNGVAVGPLIGAGMAYLAMKMVELLTR
ncbi:DUF441 domain-containing protein [Fictibacillus iocasae]|uniref:UPF0756 membrane protein ACFQPF_17310 n=1 Tax=Fictibacillus iocasae TaxID=2715437 RepID=A0ABW2NSH8_9BACL